MKSDEDKILTMDEVSKMLSCSKKSLRNWDRDGKLVAYRTSGGHRQYKLSDVEKYIADSKSTNYLRKEISAHWSQSPDSAESAEKEIERLTHTIEKMKKDKDYFIRDLTAIQGLFESMRNLLTQCRSQMLPFELAKDIDRILRESKGYMDEF